MLVPLRLVIGLVIKLVVLEIAKRSENLLHDHVSSCQGLLLDFGGLDSIAENLNQQVFVKLVYRLLSTHPFQKR